jgi:pimeloyl-ACP methyl ester carboxylesterase
MDVVFTEKKVKSLHPGGFHEIVYSEFAGNPKRTVICAHGLSRNGRDFDWLAQNLCAQGYRVICPDMAGRGRSAPFENPAWYNYPQYMADMVALLAHLDVEDVTWIGTSMGGILGMMLANQKNHPIRRMVINDIGPFIPKEALQRIKTYVTLNPTYSTWHSYEAAFRKRMAMFGLEADEEWDYLVKISTVREANGSYRMNYDTRVAFGLENSGRVTDLDLWPLWNAVDMPLLLLRGAESDVLLRETMDRMMIGKRAEAVTFAGVGHAPALMSAQQIAVITNRLSRVSS